MLKKFRFKKFVLKTFHVKKTQKIRQTQKVSGKFLFRFLLGVVFVKLV